MIDRAAYLWGVESAANVAWAPQTKWGDHFLAFTCAGRLRVDWATPALFVQAQRGCDVGVNFNARELTMEEGRDV